MEILLNKMGRVYSEQDFAVVASVVLTKRRLLVVFKRHFFVAGNELARGLSINMNYIHV
tara:strand:- start:2196 stop:2372 length:177 start_codon:yes stop_codon:yes gene_type:complete